MKKFQSLKEKERFLFDGDDDEEIARLRADPEWEEIEDDGSSDFRADAGPEGTYVAGVSGRLRKVAKPDSRRENPGLEMGSGVLPPPKPKPKPKKKPGRPRKIRPEPDPNAPPEVKRGRGRPKKGETKADVERAAKAAAAGPPSRRSSRLSQVWNAEDSKKEEGEDGEDEESEGDAGGGEDGKL